MTSNFSACAINCAKSLRMRMEARIDVSGDYVGRQSMKLLRCCSLSAGGWTRIVLEQATHHVGRHWLPVQWQERVHDTRANARTLQQDGNFPARNLGAIQLAQGCRHLVQLLSLERRREKHPKGKTEFACYSILFSDVQGYICTDKVVGRHKNG